MAVLKEVVFTSHGDQSWVERRFQYLPMEAKLDLPGFIELIRVLTTLNFETEIILLGPPHASRWSSLVER